MIKFEGRVNEIQHIQRSIIEVSEKQAKDEEEKAKQKSFADTKSGNNSLNKTITDILSVGAKKNI